MKQICLDVLSWFRRRHFTNRAWIFHVCLWKCTLHYISSLRRQSCALSPQLHYIAMHYIRKVWPNAHCISGRLVAALASSIMRRTPPPRQLGSPTHLLFSSQLENLTTTKAATTLGNLFLCHTCGHNVYYALPRVTTDCGHTLWCLQHFKYILTTLGHKITLVFFFATQRTECFSSAHFM